MKPPMVFICHATGDDLCYKLARYIKRHGWNYYIAEANPEYEIGINEKIRRQIRNSDFIVGILGEKPSSSIYGELGYATDRIPKILMADKESRADHGILNDGLEVERFDRDNFIYSARRIFTYMYKKKYGKEPNLDAERPILTSREIPMTHNSSSPNQITTQQFSRPNDHIDPELLTHAERTDRVPFWYEKYDKYIKMLTDDISCILAYGCTWRVGQACIDTIDGHIWITAVVDTSTRFILSHTLSPIKPNVSMITRVFKIAQLVAKTPKIIKTDFRPTYADAIKNTFGSTNQIIKNLPVHSHHKGSLLDLEEHLKLMLEKARDRSFGHSIEKLQSIMNYEIINYNFIRRHDDIDKVPSAAARFGLQFKNFDDILYHASSYEKTFIFKLDDMIRLVKIYTYAKSRKFIVKINNDVKKSDKKKIEAILLECGFQPRNKKWIHRLSYPNLYAADFRRKLPARTFEICNNCGRVSGSLQEVFLINGFRNDKVMKTQPCCRNCRYGPIISKIYHGSLLIPPNTDRTLHEFFECDTIDRPKSRVIKPCEDYEQIQEHGCQMQLDHYETTREV